MKSRLFRIFLSLSMLLMLSVSTAQTGPGGIGNSSSNGLWLRADDIFAASGSTISSWSDYSGNNNNAGQSVSTKRPVYLNTSTLNNMPIVRLDGTDDEMSVPDADILDNSSGLTYYVVLRPNNLNGEARGILGKRITYTVSVEYAYTWFFYGSNYINHDIHTQNNRYTSSPNAFSNANNYILSFDFDGSLPSNQRSRMYRNGTKIAQATETSTALPNSNQNLAIGALNEGYGTYLGADYGEIIHFNYSLDTLEHIIVQNYLSAKYNIPLAVHNYYDEDDAGNGNYDFDVAGIGRFSASIVHDDSRGSGIVRINNPTNLNSNEYLFWGHDGGIQEAVDFSDVPAGVQARFERVWRTSEVNSSGTAVDVGSIDISWDLTDLGPVVASDLRLLVDSNNNGVFADDLPLSGAVDIGGGIFRFNAVSAISNNLRFTLGTINNPQTPLPIELTSFSATALESAVKLNWTTASESNNDFFSVERSSDGKNWKKIVELDGAGNSSVQLNYETFDQDPIKGVSYYRLKQTDFNGEFTRSDIRSVEFRQASDYIIYPNPSEGVFTIILDEEPLNVEVFDSQGKRVFTESNIENTHFSLDLSAFSKGSYLLKITTNTAVILEKIMLE